MGAVMHDLIIGCVEDAIEREHGRFTADQSNLAKLLKFGDGVDEIAKHTMVYDVAAGVRTGTQYGFVSFEVDDLMLERGASDPFFVSIHDVNTIEFTQSKSGRLLVTATVEGVLHST